MAAQNRRIHNFGQHNRLPSIEVYSTSPSHEDDRNINGNCNGNTTGCWNGTNRGLRSKQQQQQQQSSSPATTTQLTDFRILSSSLSPSSRYSHARMSISSSKSTGNLAHEDETMDSQPVHHASSHGRLSSRQIATSPRELRGNRNQNHRNRMQSSPKPNTRFLQSFASFDECGHVDELDDQVPVAALPQEMPVTFNTEPATVLGNVIRPSAHETTSRKVEIRYSARNDKYKRPTNPIRMKANGKTVDNLLMITSLLNLLYTCTA